MTIEDLRYQSKALTSSLSTPSPIAYIIPISSSASAFPDLAAEAVLHRLLKLTFFHQVACVFNFSKNNRWKYYKYKQILKHFLILFAFTSVSFPIDKSFGDKLPEPLSINNFHNADPKEAALGRLLFYDKILSGNHNISCGTCHHHDFGGGDGLSLGIGEGGIGVGNKRTAGKDGSKIKKRIPRNAPGLWNLGSKEIHTLMHDGRISISNIYGNGFNTPAEELLPDDLDNILSVQALFPMTRQFEMAGNFGENEIIGLVSKIGKDRRTINAVWPVIVNRIRGVPKYVDLFIETYDEINDPMEIKINHIANAISAFIIKEWTSFDLAF